MRALLASTQQPSSEPASAGVIAAALALIEADRAQTLTTDHIDALDNAIKIQRSTLKLPPPSGEVTDEAIAAVDEVLKGNAVFFGREKLRRIVEAAGAQGGRQK
ncbi:hypothetical protein WT24_27075 [Burkholderia sp. MSMB1078WGS]|nr:hypothetical protein WT24_27075 [Burkholderia sp. MSMB1078WGS]